MNANEEPGTDNQGGADIGAGADVLEARYRRILRLLPPSYREQRGEEILSTLLDAAGEGKRWPSVAQVTSLASLAMRLRVGEAGNTPRAIAAGEVLRRTALAGLLGMGLWQATAGIVKLVTVLYGTISFPYLLENTWTWPLTLHFVQPFGYLGAFAALVSGRRRLGRFLGVAQVVVVAAPEFLLGRNLPSAEATALSATAVVIALATGLGFHRGAAPLPTPGRWFAAAGWLAGFVLVVVSVASAVELEPGADPPAILLSLVRLVVGPFVPVLAAIFGVRRARTSPIWPAALLLLGLPGLILLPQAVVVFGQGETMNVYIGEFFSGAPWSGMAAYTAITDIVLAGALAWALYRRARSTAVAA